jgi:hypothetical protein
LRSLTPLLAWLSTYETQRRLHRRHRWVTRPGPRLVSTHAPAFQLKVGPTGRYLVDRDGRGAERGRHGQDGRPPRASTVV